MNNKEKEEKAIKIMDDIMNMGLGRLGIDWQKRPRIGEEAIQVEIIRQLNGLTSGALLSIALMRKITGEKTEGSIYPKLIETIRVYCDCLELGVSELKRLSEED